MDNVFEPSPEPLPAELWLIIWAAELLAGTGAVRETLHKYVTADKHGNLEKIVTILNKNRYHNLIVGCRQKILEETEFSREVSCRDE